MTMKKIYLDNNATTRPADEVIEVMLACLRDDFGNPSSPHRFGEKARDLVDEARKQAAAMIGCRPDRIIFTSGATEANNQAIFSAAAAHPEKRHIISSRVEHDSVLKPLAHLESSGYEIDFVPVDEAGMIDLDTLEKKIRNDTLMVSLMGANNETGVLWPVTDIGRICREHGVLYHCDAVQMAGKIPLPEDFCDYFSISGHKLHGPKGIGLLYSHRRAPLVPLVHGAGQEFGRRAGTENVPAIAGLGAACRLATERGDGERERIKGLRNLLEEGIRKIPGAMIIGSSSPRLPNTCNVCFRYCSGAGITQELDTRGIAVSTHSACHSGDLDPSHVLLAMGVPEDYVHGSIRISMSHYTSKDEVDRLLAALKEVVTRAGRNFTG